MRAKLLLDVYHRLLKHLVFKRPLLFMQETATLFFRNRMQVQIIPDEVNELTDPIKTLECYYAIPTPPYVPALPEEGYVSLKKNKKQYNVACCHAVTICIILVTCHCYPLHVSRINNRAELVVFVPHV